MNPIAPMYWRLVKAGTRTFASISDATVKADVKILAKQDVVSNIINAEQYKTLIGEVYVA